MKVNINVRLETEREADIKETNKHVEDDRKLQIQVNYLQLFVTSSHTRFCRQPLFE